MGGANCVIAFGGNHWTKTPIMNSVIHPVTGKEIKYKDIMKDPELAPLFEICLGNELGCICQGIRDIAGTNTAFFVKLASIPKDRKDHARQNSLRLQTEQNRKTSGQTHGGRRQTRL
jgi:hypothetical protein